MSNQWSNLAKIVYKRTYARTDTGRAERWEETVARVIEGNIGRYRNTPSLLPNEEERLRYYLSNRKAGPAGRGWWFSGSPNHQKLGGAATVNCFAHETEIITAEGIKKIGECAGSIQTILTEGGKWVEAPIRSFGKQSLKKLVLVRGGDLKEIFVTANHRWFAADRRKPYRNNDFSEFTTNNLRPGIHRLQYIFGQGVKGKVEPCPIGIAHGITYGDGSTTAIRNGNRLLLCGEKDKELLKFFPNLPRIPRPNLCEGGAIEICNLPNFFRKLPSLDETKGYLYGWLAGYFAADGSVTRKGQPVITSSKRENILFVRSLCSLIGIGTYSIQEEHVISNLTEKPHTMYTMVLMRDTLDEGFFLLETHKERFLSNPIGKRCFWTVQSVEDTDRVEEVFCATVEGIGKFALADNILTGNCWFLALDDWENYVVAQDLLMLGGGVGASVEHRFVSKLPKIKRDVTVVHQNTNDADFIVPDSRAGWNKLTERVLRAFFETGKSFSFSTICVRGAGEPIKGFGGIASGPLPLIECVNKLCRILQARSGKHLRPIDAADIMCCIGELVVSGNVRRSAIIILGDPWDKEYLQAKRWDLGIIPSYRAKANFSVCCDDVEDLHPQFWKTYEHGEPFGLMNRKNVQQYGRMGEKKKDTAVGLNPCGEAVLESYESCNLQEIALPHLADKDEFIEAAILMHRWGKRVSCDPYHIAEVQEVVKRNRRIGTGITGCLQSPLFTADVLDEAYQAIQNENVNYSKMLGIAESIRTTVVKPSGTMSKMMDMRGYEGVHVPIWRHYIQRIRFAANDPLIPLLRTAGHFMEPEQRLDGTVDANTMVVDFYEEAPNGPVVNEGWDMWKQLETVQLAQTHWADQSVSCTVYYQKSQIPELKEWLSANYGTLKTISFLAFQDHGFKQAPKEGITAEEYRRRSVKIRSIDFDEIGGGDMDNLECAGGMCPIK